MPIYRVFHPTLGYLKENRGDRGNTVLDGYFSEHLAWKAVDRVAKQALRTHYWLREEADNSEYVQNLDPSYRSKYLEERRKQRDTLEYKVLTKMVIDSINILSPKRKANVLKGYWKLPKASVEHFRTLGWEIVLDSDINRN